MPTLLGMPSRRLLVNLAAAALTSIFLLSLAIPSSRGTLRELLFAQGDPSAIPPSSPGSPPPPPPPPAKPKYKPAPAYLPPPIKDNFPLLATSSPPPVPKWNQPRADLHKEYDLPTAPPLLIGFTRTWPLLQQAVVSYITAGWPASQIYVVENTGTQQANARGQLSLQNPFFLNHTSLAALGVNVITTPTLLSFAQLQNFFLSLTYSHAWPYYFWSHMDVLALSFEAGQDGLTPAYNQPGYKSLYELALSETRDARAGGKRWGARFFAYDHLALVNPAAYEAVGGWDTLIPYYMTDCDMHTRLEWAGWHIEEVKAGEVSDVAAALDDLAVLYRVDGVEPSFTDPNPPPPKKEKEEGKQRARGVGRWLRWWGKRAEGVERLDSREEGEEAVVERDAVRQVAEKRDDEDPNLARWHALRRISHKLYEHKHGDRDRNTWQLGQHGGQGEPFYYDAAGLAQGIDVMTETGREMFRRKWGHRDCGLNSAGLTADDAWKVEKDWD